MTIVLPGTDVYFAMPAPLTVYPKVGAPAAVLPQEASIQGLCSLPGAGR